ncbi:hypothetical protein RU080_10075 [Shewanella algae]|uniref:hypothetical protein n=1 Tax=Shewanella algae TaxID=38313 RepID=UPI002936813E|nr:hypothetical protein [Shewanella algae]MDV2962078.1 hypothetical protein [Shewanella algae]
MIFLRDKLLDKYDMGIFGLGYESRSKEVFIRHYSKCLKTLAIGYLVNNENCSYPSNLELFKSHNCTISECRDTDIENTISRFLGKPIKTKSVLLDITSMSRHRLTRVIEVLNKLLPNKSTITIFYSIADYTPPPTDGNSIKFLGELSEGLSGGLCDISKPVALVLGLGYEKFKAHGVYNYLDPSECFLLIPNGSDEKFGQDVNNNNSSLIKTIPSEKILNYNVFNPISIYSILSNLLVGLSIEYRPLVIPLGPKILTAISAVIGLSSSGEFPIWRVSSEYEKPVDRSSSHEPIYFSIMTDSENNMDTQP